MFIFSERYQTAKDFKITFTLSDGYMHFFLYTLPLIYCITFQILLKYKMPESKA